MDWVKDRAKYDFGHTEIVGTVLNCHFRLYTGPLL